MNPGDEQTIRQRLHTELGSLEISPAPLIAVTRRGKAIRARRRALTGGFAAVVAVAVLAGRLVAGQGPAPVTVTQNEPRPGAPDGVFASGTADGKPWRLAVRNIAADPGTQWCLPAVMFNGRDGDVLFHTGPHDPSFGNPAFLDDIPGFPGVGAVFTQVAPQDTELVGTLPSGRHLSVRPVWVSACGQRFHLAGFAYANSLRGLTQLGTSAPSGPDESLVIMQSHSTGGGTDAGIWANLDKSQGDIAASAADTPIGTGTLAGQRWQIRTGLGLYGQCYNATLRGQGGQGHSFECVPVAAPPRTAALAWVPVPGKHSELTGYAGLVSPRTAKVAVGLTDGTIPPAKPVIVTGRAYIAFVIPPGCQVTRLRLLDSAGHTFASVTAPPAAR